MRRSGRITAAQNRALQEYWAEYGIDYSPHLLDLDEVYGRPAPRVLEIGFGNGEKLVRDAAENPGTDFLGIEVHEPGIGRCLMAAHDLGLGNLHLINHDAVEVLQHQIPDGAFSRINLYFPDPWPKKRHHKRRLVQPAFLQLAAAKLAPSGTLHIATDWENYAEHIDALIAASPFFKLDERHVKKEGLTSSDQQTTKFERRGLQQGHNIWNWRLIKS